MDFQLSISDFNVIMPEIVLSIGGMLMLFLELFMKERKSFHQWTAFSVFILAFMMVLTYGGDGNSGFGGMVRADLFSQFIAFIVLIGGTLTVLAGKEYFMERDWHRGEYYSLLLFASAGMLFMARGTDLIIIFLGLELLSISLYVLVGYFRDRLISNEAGLKYLLLGAFSSGFLLYGIAFIYGAFGTTNLMEIKAAGVPTGVTFLYIGISLLFVGLAFKVALVPFHMWSPDVYEGAPTPVTGFMATTTKAAAFAAMLRILLYSFPQIHIDLIPLLWLLSALTMTVGNVLAMQQRSVKRMLAYSSIAHAGYLMVAITTGSNAGAAGMLFYLLGYLFMNIGAFTVVQLLEGKDESQLDLESYAGLAKKRPALSIAMTVFMFALAGFPLTAGFTGKFYIFSTAVNEGFIWLIVIAVLNSLISVYYYLRVIVNMYMKPGETDGERLPTSYSAGLGLVICVYAVIHIGIFPSSFIRMAENAVSSLFK